MRNFRFLFLILIISLSSGCTGCRYVNNGINTAYDEFKPSELLRKYEWFKDASAQCDNKMATLQMYESRFDEMKESYGPDSLHRKNWARSDIEQWNIWQSEYIGVKASYNDLAAQYNAGMVKFNYRFCNAGTLPEGAETPLPREFKPYITK